MEGRRRALYNYSWQQSPINKHRRVNPPEEEKKIFDNWFEEKADEYFPWIRDQGLDDETIRSANASRISSSPPCNPEMYRALSRVSPKMILKRLQRPEQDRKTLAEEEEHKKTERLANFTRYERSLKETRKIIDKIKKEKQEKVMFSQTQHQRLSNPVVFLEHSECSASNEVSSFQKKPCEEQVAAKIESDVYDDRKLESELKSNSFSSTRRTSCGSIGEHSKQTTSERKQQTSIYHEDDDSDNELLRLALESSPIQKSNSARKIFSNEDELSDEALLSMMISSPVPIIKK
ncbi:unnamed protein product [Cercopithifilaria johnstoni]|uniref:Uncharacterized protein n=1 Tax=Cercopithifilaria johnstoni TaxID=2874296 RepID=A0A8J2LUY1_9BILA|nr:unnamed protein product [Cercopithifilaria johnstoni]